MNHLKKIFVLLLFLPFNQCTNKNNLYKDGVYIDIYQGKSRVIKNGDVLDIKGVAGSKYVKEARMAGANVIRTWDEQHAQEILDSALVNNLYVLLGIYIPAPRHGYDFEDQEFIQQQKDRISSIVNRYKDHPALLFWAVGNEVEIIPKNYKVWIQLNKLVSHTKSIVPAHPVTTMIAPFRRAIFYSRLFLRDIDFLSVNCFGQLPDLERHINTPIFGWTGPVIISEWGTNGPWEELEKTKWGVPIEKNSTTKASIIKQRYYQYLHNQSSIDLLGTFIFYWGNKDQFTNTWFSIFSENGERSEVYYAMKEIWTGENNENKPPTITGLYINQKSAYDDILISSKDTLLANVEVSARCPDSLVYKWKILKDNIIIDEHDQLAFAVEAENVDFDSQFNRTRFIAGLDEGPYRLFVEICDKKNNFAYANIPFYILK